ncbi:MAG: hypothetical protein NTW03_21235 [Verrucomicrobia bacterium]|nr:hypothetical protein [Verrucomicrobiota bacterium]
MKMTREDPKLTAYALGELPPSERAAVEAELSQSPECRQAVEEIRETATLLARELAAEPCPELRGTQQEAVLALVPKKAEAKSGGSLSELWHWFTWSRALALAGAAVGVAAAVLWWPSRETRPSQENVAVNDIVTNTPQPAASDFSTGPVLLAQATLPGTSFKMSPLPLKLPMPSFKGTPDDLPKGPNIEPFSDKPRPPFLAPPGVLNVGLGKKVTSSDKAPISGSLDQITDGNKEAVDDSVVELHKGVQWVQIDLERRCQLTAIVIWHDHRYVQLFRAVIAQLADDADFTQNVRTIFNNDHDNSSGLGVGMDKEYFETHQGKLIDAHNAIGRFVRLYSKGGNVSALNCYTEVEAWGLPAEANSLAPVAVKNLAPQPSGEDHQFTNSPQPALVPPGTSPAMAPLPLTLPGPSFKGTPEGLPTGPQIELFTDKPRPPFLAPAGVRNVGLGKKVTSSDKAPISGSLDLITDGNKEAIDDAVVEMHKNAQWVQIDLQTDYDIYAIVLWHDHRYVQVFRCVVVQAADDPDFTRNVQTLFNNDYENMAGLGLGHDKQYFETNQGKLIDSKGIKARYLRFYSKGSTSSALNCYTEIEVYALPVQ